VTSGVNTSSLAVAHAVCKDMTKKDRLLNLKTKCLLRFETSDNKNMFDNVCKLPSTIQTRKTAFLLYFVCLCR